MVSNCNDGQIPPTKNEEESANTLFINSASPIFVAYPIVMTKDDRHINAHNNIVVFRRPSL